MYLSDLMLPELSVDTVPADGELITRYSQVGKYRVSAGREKERKKEGREEERKARLIGGKCFDFVIN